MLDEKLISQIVESVISNMNGGAVNVGSKGVFDSMTDALAAVKKAYKQFRSYSVAQREKMIANIRKLTLEEAEVMAKMGVEETKMGRVADKIIKHQLVANKTPGTEDLKPQVITGDDGMTLIEMAPYGIIGSITPSTNPSETVLCNSMGMIAGGNAVVFNPHPHACRTANYAVDLVNRAILEAGGPENLVVSVSKPTMDTSKEMMECPDDILDGIRAVMKALDIPRAFIGIEDNKPDAIALLNEKTKDTPIRVEALRSIYPQGAEKVLIYNTTGRIVEEGELPADKGVVVMNVTTVANLSRYLKTGMPLTQKRVTIDGNFVEHPMNVRVPIGTSVRYLLDFAGIDGSRVKKVLLGGPMMGSAMESLDVPIVKNNNAIILFDEEAARVPKTTACIRCGRCIDVCPMNLMPANLERAYDAEDLETLLKLKVSLCINCGSCSYVCPAKRNLAQKNQLAKALLRRKK